MSYVKPDELIDSIVHAGVDKTNLTTTQMLLRGILAGAILAAATTVALTASAQTGLPIVGAVLFPVGFVIIILLGLELVTGSFALIPLAILEGRTTIAKGAKNFGVVIGAHVIGAVSYALLYVIVITYMGTETTDPMIKAIIAMAEHKVLPYVAVGAGGVIIAIIKAMLCNWMVAIGTIIAYTSKSTAGKIMAMWLPVTIFFSLGFEHVVVNMFVIPAGMMLGAHISLGELFGYNLIPVLIGNFLGGAVLTALPLYFSHRRRVNRATALDLAAAAADEARLESARH